MTEYKKGVFALYKGKEYVAATEEGTDRVFLFSKDAADVANGFVRTSFGDFEKAVGSTEINSIYQCAPFAIYQGVRVHVESIENGKAELSYHGTDQADQLVKAGFEQFDRYSYMKVVPVGEIQGFVVEKIPLLGTKLPEDLA